MAKAKDEELMRAKVTSVQLGSANMARVTLVGGASMLLPKDVAEWIEPGDTIILRREER